MFIEDRILAHTAAAGNRAAARRNRLARRAQAERGAVEPMLDNIDACRYAKGMMKRAKGPVRKAFVYAPLRRPGKTYRRVIGDVVQGIFKD